MDRLDDMRCCVLCWTVGDSNEGVSRVWSIDWLCCSFSLTANEYNTMIGIQYNTIQYNDWLQLFGIGEHVVDCKLVNFNDLFGLTFTGVRQTFVHGAE